MGKKAIITGATGLIGRQLLDMLLQDDRYDEVLAIVRKKTGIVHPKLSQLEIDFDRMDEYSTQIAGDVVFCCLGTTRKQTPDKQRYYRIEHDYPVNLARIAEKNNVNQFHAISAIGASPKSANFYSRNKGEMERDISLLDFQALYIYQPSLLTGARPEKRSGEGFFEVVMKFVNPLLFGEWKKYRSIPASSVARAMYDLSLQGDPGKWLIRFGSESPSRRQLI